MSSAAMTCGKCGADVSSAKRMKDSKGRYFCEPCGTALRQLAAAKLGPTVPSAPLTGETLVSLTAGADAAPSRSPSATPAPPDDGTFALADDPPQPAKRPSIGLETLSTCPDCGHPFGTDSDICRGCGFNRTTGHHIGKGAVVTESALPASKHVVKPCKKCGYDMTGSKTGRCPECGTINTRMLRAKQTEANTLKSMFVGPAIMIGIGLAIAVVVYFIQGMTSSTVVGAAGGGGIAGGAGTAGWYLAYFVINAVIGFAAYVGCSIAFVGFDEPLGVTFVRLAGVYAVTDAVGAVLRLFIPGFIAWPLLAIVYVGLLMQIMELDWEEAWLVSIITYIVRVAIFAAMWYVWLVYF